MENILIISQIIFYSVFSLAIIVLGFLMAVVAYHLVNIVKELEVISKELHDASGEAKEKIKDIIERLSSLPLLSFLLNKTKTKEGNQKGRKKTNKK
jgi:flagellar motor component MotA